MSGSDQHGEEEVLAGNDTGFEHVPDEIIERDLATTARRMRRAYREGDRATFRFERARMGAMTRERNAREKGRER